jgi:hypothetical protein
MPTPVESATLILRLYELRRETVLREARQWFLADFTPETYEELTAMAGAERNASYRMVIGYWDMACSFVTFGAIDREMFLAANGEIFATMSKVVPFLEEVRQRSGIVEFGRHAESLVTTAPGGIERMERLRAYFVSRKAKAPDLRS